MEIRPIEIEEYPTFQRTFMRAMGFGPPSDAYIERWQPETKTERSLAAFDREQMVGTAYSYLFELTVPGGAQIDAAGVTAVGVLATHRRRGIITDIMRRQLADAKDRGEAVAILVASEAVIYGRFGYGASSYLCDYEIDKYYGAFAEPYRALGVFFVDEETADKVFPDLYEGWRRTQPGAIPRSDFYWRNMWADRKPHDEAHVIHEDASGNVDAYVRYHVNSQWDAGLANSTIDVRDMIATNEEGAKALWRHMLDVDLVRHVKGWARPVDEPLRWWLANPRGMKITRYGDLYWTRILDIPRSLATRTYRADGELILEITDPQFDENNGRFALTIWGGKARCDRTDKPADLRMGVSALGAMYLGGVTASDLARGGRVVELRDGMLDKADAAFSSNPKPWSPTWF
jgi:predicted acetyltransferase